jgi:hypothetical protein
MGKLHRGLDVNPVAMPPISHSYQARVRDIPAATQKKEIAIANRKFETLGVGFKGLQQTCINFVSPSRPCRFLIGIPNTK